MELHVEPARRLVGEVTVPGDKSISHRAAIIGALAEGDTLITGFLEGADCLNTLSCLEAAGVEVMREGRGSFRVRGLGIGNWKEPEDVLDCGNSGTTMRLLAGALVAQRGLFVLTGDASLRQRPMGRIVSPLRLMGAEISGRRNGEFAPLVITGQPELEAISYRSPVASAQVKSALLLAGLHASGTTCVEEPFQSRDHTERMLAAFGAEIRKEGLKVSVSGFPRLEGQRIDVPGDMSGAAFLLVAGAVLPGSEVAVRNVGLNPTRTGVIDVLRSMGACLEVTVREEIGGEPRGDVVVRGGELRAVSIPEDIIPRIIDEIPVLAVAAALAEGTSVFRGVEELKFKESNRLYTVVTELRRLGARADWGEGELRVEGPVRLKGARCYSHGDHRIAMSLAVAALAAKGSTVIEGAECISVSFPTFADTLAELRTDN